MVRVLAFYSVDLSSILLSLQFYSVKLRQFMMDNNQICCNIWVDAYKPAPPSTKELHGLHGTQTVLKLIRLFSDCSILVT